MPKEYKNDRVVGIDFPTIEDITDAVAVHGAKRLYVWRDEPDALPQLITMDGLIRVAREHIVDLTTIGGPPEAVDGFLRLHHDGRFGPAAMLEV